jgi:hypothetical protein
MDAEEKKKEEEQEEGEVEDDEDDDIDEDELYLRLIALRSMAPDLEEDVTKAEVSKEDDIDKVDEMMELLQEADEAANEDDDEEEVEVTEVQVVGDEEEEEDEEEEDEDFDDIECYMKNVNTTDSYLGSQQQEAAVTEEKSENLAFLMQKLRNSLQKQRVKEVVVAEQYSPSQSPIHEAFSPDPSRTTTPVGEEAFENISTEDEVSLSSQSPASSLPDHDPVEEEAVGDIPPPPYDDNAQPLPPGEDSCEVDSVVPMRAKSPSVERGSNLDAVPMEITSENEAEIQFFQSQKELNDSLLFPKSVWGFKAASANVESDAYWKAVTTGQQQERPIAPGRRRRRKRSHRVRRKSSGSVEEIKRIKMAAAPPELVLLDDDEDDDEDLLRANLLKSLKEKRTAALGAGSAPSSPAPSPAPAESASSPAPVESVPSPALAETAPSPLTAEAALSPTPVEAMPFPEPVESAPLPPSAQPAKSSIVKTSTSLVPSKSAVIKTNASATQTRIARKTTPIVPPSTLAPVTLVQNVSVAKKVVLPTRGSSPLAKQRLLRRLDPKNNPDAARLKSSEALQRKFFPNLFNKVSFTAVIDKSSRKINFSLMSGIDQLLREGRLDAERKKKRTPPPKPARKHPPKPVRHKITAPPVVAKPRTRTVSSSSLFSPAQKQKLVKSSIKHLSMQKQREYQLLLSLIRTKKSKTTEEAEMRQRLIEGMKVKDKVASVAVKKTPAQGAPESLVNQQQQQVRQGMRVTVTNTADGEEGSRVVLRQQALGQPKMAIESKKPDATAGANLAPRVCKVDAKDQVEAKKPVQTVSKGEVEVKKPVTPVSTVDMKDPSAGNVCVKVATPKKTSPSPIKAAVKPLAKKPSPRPKSSPVARKKKPVSKSGKDTKIKVLDPEKQKRLSRLESSVVNKRKELKDTLFKMSAQISTLKGEKEQLKKAKDLAAELQRRLKETLQLVDKKEERIAGLNKFVMESHGQVNERKLEVRKVEAECFSSGASMIGLSYKVPLDHSATIQKKLDSIRSNAESLQQETTPKKVPELPKRDPESAKRVPGNAVPDLPRGILKNNADSSTKEPGVLVPPPPPMISGSNVVPLGPIGGGKSSLAHLKSVHQFDPHKEFCRFELQGKCNDDSCPYQHHSKLGS